MYCMSVVHLDVDPATPVWYINVVFHLYNKTSLNINLAAIMCPLYIHILYTILYIFSVLKLLVYKCTFKEIGFTFENAHMGSKARHSIMSKLKSTFHWSPQIQCWRCADQQDGTRAAFMQILDIEGKNSTFSVLLKKHFWHQIINRSNPFKKNQKTPQTNKKNFLL